MKIDPVMDINSKINSLNSTLIPKGQDSPSMFLVSTFLTGNENWIQWKFSILSGVRSKKEDRLC